MKTGTICLILMCAVAVRSQLSNIRQCLTKQFDVVILVDESGSINDLLFTKARAFSQKFANLQNIDECAVRFSIIQYSDKADDLLDLKDGDTRCNVNEGIFKLKREKRGTTCTYCGLKEAQNQLKSFSKGYVPDLVIVFTNGGANDPDKVKQISKQLKEDGVTAICINLGTSSSSQGCLDITVEEKDQVFGINDNNLLKKVQKKWCDIVDVDVESA